MRRFVSRSIAALAVLALAACTTLGLDHTVKRRALDYLNDDIASLLIAFDLPDEIQPIPELSILNFDVVSPSGDTRHVKVVLALADADELAGTLPPPALHRGYYLLAFSDKDKQALRDVQSWARAVPQNGSRPSMSLAPAFCHIGPVDPKTVRVSILLALPGSANLAPLIENETLAASLAATGSKDLPACQGNSS